jgi:L-lactate dehydrogenase complex protein LldE
MKKLSLFIPCIVDTVFPEIGEAMVVVLRRLGYDVEYPGDQTCCGLPAVNAGFRKEARRLAGHFLDVFEGCEWIVCPSGSCVHMVRHRYPELFSDDATMLGKVKALGARVFELSEFLVDVEGVEDVGAAYSGKVAYHESCSLLNGLGISEQPKRLIRAVRGTTLVPMNGADVCCGFGGSFSFHYPEISGAMVADKVRNYLESGADCLLLCEPGCLLNIGGYLAKNHPEKKVMHLAGFLAEHMKRDGVRE